MKVQWQADPTPGVEDGEPAEGVIDAPDLQAALAELQQTYPPDEWALMVTEVYVPPPADTPMTGG
ncbi:hypothetical protein QDA02_gp87 [Microbacterium phage Margaery]|uniref:Uncharacterized protein n=1 Tax=Microbacterium phage Margaery TaxID=2591217 RepID=A0A514DHH9_9CAUD|nr:hypothetical protein QDA02_gp87 [Microbacterium phage Margaery]QDH93078.1 hypothetical protein PBI_MARGAERY_21 [Microbacterium phage Margaery]